MNNIAEGVSVAKIIHAVSNNKTLTALYQVIEKITFVFYVVLVVFALSSNLLIVCNFKGL